MSEITQLSFETEAYIRHVDAPRRLRSSESNRIASCMRA